jgi:hypothetical protein
MGSRKDFVEPLQGSISLTFPSTQGGAALILGSVVEPFQGSFRPFVD